MSLTKVEANKPTFERRRFEWEDEETLVDRRRRWDYRIRRIFTLRRVVIAVFLYAALTDADFMRSIINFPNTQMGATVFRGIFGIAIAIGQFALIFWFLGRARMYTIWPGGSNEGVSFADYRGQPELLEQARQIVTLLRGVRVFEQAGGEPLNGLLLEGPPGTGKTWLAQAISTEAGVPFFYLDASSLSSMFFGIAPLKVMNLYRKARTAAKDYGASIVFIDEIDAVGARGGVAESDKDDFREPLLKNRNRLPIMMGMAGGQGILPTLLMEMSGFSLEHGAWTRRRAWFYKNILRRKPPKLEKRVLTIGATNRMQALDAALLRPGRFDKKVRVDAPDMEGRRDIIVYYLSKMAHDDTMDPLILAAETQGYTPADIKYLLNEALRYALFDGRTYMTYRDFRYAQPEHEMGLRSPITNLSREDKYRLAAHEAGHAMAVRLYSPSYRISRITIIRQGAALGHVSYRPAEEVYDYALTYEWFMDRLRVAVAGRAGEIEFCGEPEQTLGVGGDFAGIRAVLNAMASAGMFGSMGVYQPEAQEVLKLKEEVFLEVLTEVRIAMRQHHEMGEHLISILVEQDEMLADEVEAFFDQYGLHTPKIKLRPDEDEVVVEGQV